MQLSPRATEAGQQISSFCQAPHTRQAELAVHRTQGILSFAEKYGAARVDDAYAAALELEAYDYRFVRCYLEYHSQPPLNLRHMKPLMRQLNLYLALINERTKETK
jgi:hypothetical protein